MKFFKVSGSILLTLFLSFAVSCGTSGDSVSNSNSAATAAAAAINPQYSLDDLSVEKDDAISEDLPNGYKDYKGRIIRVLPSSGMTWRNYSKPIYFDLGKYSGKHIITVSMSVMTESPLGNSDGKINWMILNSGSYDQFSDEAYNVSSGWTDIQFTKTIELDGSKERRIFIDGLNENKGLIDLTLYIRNFQVKVEKYYYYMALTFDDGPSDMTGALLDKLKELNIKATFFVVGMRIDALDPEFDARLNSVQREDKKKARQAIIKRMVNEGHDVANHSYTHNYLGGGKLDGKDGIDKGLSPGDILYLPGFSSRQYPLSEEAILKELGSTQDAIQQAVYGNDASRPAVSRYFRVPFSSDTGKAVNLLNVVKSLNLPLIYGEPSNDYNPGSTPQMIADTIHKQRVPWGISLNYDHQWSPNILAALDILVPMMDNSAFRFTSVSDLVQKREKALTPGNSYYSLNPDLE